MSKTLRYGIDLGTTNSCVCEMNGDNVRVFQNNDLMNVTPSVIRVLRNGSTVVGRRAYSAIAMDPENVASEFKRLMGQSDKRGFPASGKQMSPEELSAEVLKALREDVRRATGETVDSAVITVPAAFGALQCEATSRAAAMAGIKHCKLLQEPIAAAIAYGVDPRSQDQRWLVFDLGGGTLDIAVVSTHDGRLSVIEHRGDNFLGGKDIDRAFIDDLLWPTLDRMFQLPNPMDQPDEFQALRRRLQPLVEDAKIRLSSDETAPISVFEVGDDLGGNPIEAEITVLRRDLEGAIAELVNRCVRLAEEAITAARLTPKDLQKIVLVGGPTQTPYIRKTLNERLGIAIEHSLDPMTVVAQGAAIDAATTEISESEAALDVTQGETGVKLAFEPVSGSVETTISGRIEGGGVRPLEVKVEAQSGIWNSGWVPAPDDEFEAPIVLREGKVCPFWLSVRDANGAMLLPVPMEFSIRHGLELSAPPLPHTISVEIVKPNGKAELDPIFPRGTPLPAEKRLYYRAAKDVRPGDPNSEITVKLWEGEDMQNPDTNEWVGNVSITSTMVHRVIPQGTELEITFKIDASRLITVEIYVPHLQHTFADGVYLAERQQRSGTEVVRNLGHLITALSMRIRMLEQLTEHHGREEDELALIRIRRNLEDLDVALINIEKDVAAGDTEAANRLASRARDLQRQLATFEEQLGMNVQQIVGDMEAQEKVSLVETDLNQYGTELEKMELAGLKKNLDASASRNDRDGVARSIQAMMSLRWRVLAKHYWFWQKAYDQMDKTEGAFINPSQAQHYMLQAEGAIEKQDKRALEEAVLKLWDLQPDDVGPIGDSTKRGGITR